MDFRLTYEGELMVDGGADHKQRVRKVFHKQLKRFWQIHPILQGWSTQPAKRDHDGNIVPDPDKKSLHDRHANNFTRGKYRCIPIATSEFKTIVSLDILFLRSGQPGSIMKSGDIDGRLKTLFDALKVPTQNNEFGTHEPSEGEDPFYCLMEDDRLVGNVSVTTDTLLEPTPHSAGYYDTNDARIVIAVNLKRYASSGLGGSFF